MASLYICVHGYDITAFMLRCTVWDMNEIFNEIFNENVNFGNIYSHELCQSCSCEELSITMLISKGIHFHDPSESSALLPV